MLGWPRHRAAAARLDHLKLADDGIPMRVLGEPEDAVGHREDGISLLFLGILTEEKGGGFPAGQMQSETLNKLFNVRRPPVIGGARLTADGPE